MAAKPEKIQARVTEFSGFSLQLGRKARRTTVRCPWALVKTAFILLILYQSNYKQKNSLNKYGVVVATTTPFLFECVRVLFGCSL
jgi:hypothetical protein